MKLKQASDKELKADLTLVQELHEQNRRIEEKYEEYGCNSLYGLEKRILEELGRRSLENAK